VSPDHAERALAPVSPSGCAIGASANPHLNDDPGTIIPLRVKVPKKSESSGTACLIRHAHPGISRKDLAADAKKFAATG
jgi:hypothetical protein